MMTDISKREAYWITREGQRIPIRMMATSHLLNTIHLIERSRMQQLIGIEEQAELYYPQLGKDDARELLSHYTAWPDAYDDLLVEAEKRKLIKRGK